MQHKNECNNLVFHFFSQTKLKIKLKSSRKSTKSTIRKKLKVEQKLLVSCEHNANQKK